MPTINFQKPEFIPQSTPLWAADDYQIYLIVAWRTLGVTLTPMGVCDGVPYLQDLEEGGDGDGDVILFFDRVDAEVHVESQERKRIPIGKAREE